MTNQLTPAFADNRTDTRRWRPIIADLGFWSTAGAVVAALSGQLGQRWGAPSEALLIGGLAFVAAGSALAFWLHRGRPTPRAVVWTFGAFNLALAPITWAAALGHWLPVSGAGNWALATAGDVMLALGAWQLWSLRRS